MHAHRIDLYRAGADAFLTLAKVLDEFQKVASEEWDLEQSWKLLHQEHAEQKTRIRELEDRIAQLERTIRDALANLNVAHRETLGREMPGWMRQAVALMDAARQQLGEIAGERDARP